MRHYGDITKLSGYDLPVVDVITGGSPCQDLSVAGKRAGLAGERSGLFMEQVRIVKEMRERDARDTGRTGWAVRPRYMVWENVPGAFSSNSGKDFQAVLEEIVRIVEDEVPDLSTVVQGGWTKAGCLYDEMGAWSVAWRVHDAQFWGVPQRRKRIALVADFGGLSAPEILFERKGLSGNSEPGGAQREGTAGGTEGGAGSTISFQERAGKPGGGKGILIQHEHVGALSTSNNQACFCLQGNGIDRAETAGCNGKGWCEDVSYTLNTIDRPAVYPPVANTLSARHDGSPQPDKGNGANIVCAGFKAGQSKDGGIGYQEELAPTLSAQPSALEPTVICAGFDGQMGAKAGNIGYSPEQAPTLNAGKEMHVFDARGNGNGETVPTLTGDHQDRVTDYTALCCDIGFFSTLEEQANTLLARQYKDPPIVGSYQEQTGALLASGYSKNGTQEAANGMYVTNTSTVRRLTPMECERLQGYPDGWTDIGEWTDSKGKKHKDADSPRYKALGNSIALPFWAWMARRICAQYERKATMASLFDGIGGFPLCFQRSGAVPVWASEIEEFPIAVTKYHFPEEET